MKKFLIILTLITALSSASFAQKKEAKVIQFSGYTLTSDSLIGIPFVRITVVNHGRSVYAGPDGFFSFPVVEKDTIYFTCIGYRPVIYIVPATDGDKFTIVQLMTRNDINLPQTIIFPWGDRANFKPYFIGLHIPEDQLDIAKRNLGHERLAALGEKMDLDGQEAAERSLRTRSAQTYYYGQVAPQNIFNPLAWAEFIKAWKNGDFKKKSSSNSTNTDNNNDGNTNVNPPTPIPH